MNIAQALKEKNRVLKKLTNIRDLINLNNKRRSDQHPEDQLDVNDLFNQYNTELAILIDIKAKLAKASVPTQGMLAELSNLKILRDFYNDLDTDNTPITYPAYSGPITTINMIVQVNTKQKNQKIRELENRINQLQDELDNFNAATQID